MFTHANSINDLTEQLDGAVEELTAIRSLLGAGERTFPCQEDGTEALILTRREVRGLTRILDRITHRIEATGTALNIVGHIDKAF